MNTNLGYSKQTLTDENVLLSAGGSKALTNFVGSLLWDSTNRKLQYKSAGSNAAWLDLVTFGSNALNSTSYLSTGGGTLTGVLNLAGTDIALKTNGTSSNDSGDIAFFYGNGTEKARIWTGNEYTTAMGPNYRVYKSDGTSLYSGRLATVGELAGYLPLTGGTLKGSTGTRLALQYTANNITNDKIILSTDNEGGNITIYSPDSYKMTNSQTTIRYWHADAYNGNFRLYTETNGSVNASLNTSGILSTTGQGKLWGANNDGNGSGLDADLLDGKHASSFIELGGFLDTHGEGNVTIILDGGNDISGLYLKGGTCTAYEVSLSATLTSATLTSLGALPQINESAFGGSLGYSGNSYTGSNFAVYDFKLHRKFTYGNTVYWSFGSYTWTPDKIRILTALDDGDYTLRYTTDTKTTFGKAACNSSSDGFNRLRIVLSYYNRLSTIGIRTYSSTGLRETYMSRVIDDYVYRSITPAETNTYNLGSNSYKWNNAYLGGSLTVNKYITLLAFPDANNNYGTGNCQFYFNQALDLIRFDGVSHLNLKGNVVWDAGNFTPSNYLPLSGGTLNDNAVISRTGTAVAWVGGRYHPIIKTTSYTGYNSILSMKTTNGSWDLGVYTNDTAYLTYITDANYSASNNETTYQMSFPKDTGVIALTKQLPAASAWGTESNGTCSLNIRGTSKTVSLSSHTHSYLPLTGGTMALGEGLRFEADENYFGLHGDARIITILDTNSGEGNASVDGGLIIRSLGYLNGELQGTLELLRIRSLNGTNTITTGEFLWKGNEIIHAGNYTSYKHAYTNLTGSGTTANLVILSNGTTNGWTLKSLAPSISAGTGNTIKITVGGVDSSDYTIPYATKSDTVDGYHGSSFRCPKDTVDYDISINNTDNWFYIGTFSSSYGYTTLHIHIGSLSASIHNSVTVNLSNILGWGNSRVVFTGVATNTLSLTKLGYYVSGATGTKFYIYLKNTRDSTYQYNDYRISLVYDSLRFTPVTPEIVQESSLTYIDTINYSNGLAKIISNLLGNASTSDKWSTARTLTIGSTGKSVDGSGDVSWSLAEIGAAASVHYHDDRYLSLSGGVLTTNNATSLQIKGDNNYATIRFVTKDGSHFRTFGFKYNSTYDNSSLFVTGPDAWSTELTILTSDNSSVSLSGSTLSVKINGSTLSLTNTWRGITDSYNVDSPSSSTSLSQAGAKALYTALLNGNANTFNSQNAAYYVTCGMRNLIARNVYSSSVTGFRWTPGKALVSGTGTTNRINFSGGTSYNIDPYRSEGPYGYYSISLWYKVENYSSGSTVTVQINDRSCGDLDISANKDWAFFSGTCSERTDSNRYGFVDFEGTFNATVTVSDIVVVRGTNKSQTWFPAPEDICDLYSTLTITGSKTFSLKINGTVANADNADTSKFLASRTSLTTVSGILYVCGQLKTTTSGGICYPGSSLDESLICFPSGGTFINNPGNTSSETANIGLIRIKLGTDSYIHDFHLSPNDSKIFHRTLGNYTATVWEFIPCRTWDGTNILLGSTTKPVYINSSGKFTECNSYPSTLDNISDGTTRKLSNYLPLSGGTIAADSFPLLTLRRNHATNSAAIGFAHYSSGTTAETMGYLGMEAKDGTLLRYNSDGSTAFTIIDSSIIGNMSVNYANTAGSAPASDVSSWAKQSTKPTYTMSEVASLSVVAITANTSSSCSITGNGNAGKSQTIIYTNNSGSDKVVTVPTTYKTPNGTAIELICPNNGYCEVNYLNISGTVYARGL